MGLLTRLRVLEPTPAGYDSLSAEEHVAVLDASELLDALRPRGYGFALAADGSLKVRPPAPPATVDPATRARVVTLADAVVFVLRAEVVATPLPDTCRVCGAPVEQYSPGGHAYCEPHFALAERRAYLRARGWRRTGADDWLPPEPPERGYSCYSLAAAIRVALADEARVMTTTTIGPERGSSR